MSGTQSAVPTSGSLFGSLTSPGTFASTTPTNDSGKGLFKAVGGPSSTKPGDLRAPRSLKSCHTVVLTPRGL
jgi:hypothetical protein